MKELFNEIKFAKISIIKNIQSSAELRSSFLTSIFGMMINNIAFIIIWISFGKISGGLGGWSAVDYLLSFGISTLSFGITFGLFGGILNLPEIVKNGELDKFLLYPKNLLLRISTSSIRISAFGDLFFGLICIIAWIYLTNSFSLFVIASIILFSLLAFFIWFFFTIFIISISFYFSDSRLLVDGLLELTIAPSHFYGGAFQGITRNIFIFVIPSMLFGNLPLEIIKNPTLKMYLLVVAIVIFWILFANYIFRLSIRRYESSNFINFG